MFGVKAAGKYQWISYADFDLRMRKLRAALRRMGIGKGDVVGIIANNSVPFAMTVYATYGLGGIIVPMYEVQKTQDWDYILKDSKAKLVLVGNDTIKAQIEDLKIDTLQHIITVQPGQANREDAFERIVQDEAPLGDIDVDIDPENIADILYTSGTTGLPKGVVLSHKNIVENVVRTETGFGIGPNDRSLTFLPWAHAFGKTVELHIFPAFGLAIGLAESPRTIVQNLKEVNPTVLVAVPKVFNKVYDTIHKMTRKKPIVKQLFNYTEEIAQQSHTRKLTAFEKVQQGVLTRLIGKKIRAAFGSSLRFCISGGAALPIEVAQFFYNFGITIYEGYGLTETSPIIAVNKPNNLRLGSVGKPLEGINVWIDRDPDQPNARQGEVVAGGPCIMKGYHGDDAANAEVLNEKHELRTGDTGYLDEDGYLWLTGRVKEQYKLENGKYVVPSAIEAKIATSPDIETAIIFGNGKPYNIAILQPAPDYIEDFLETNGLRDLTQKAIEHHPALRKQLSRTLQEKCTELRGYEKPQKFIITLDEFTIQNGLLTPSFKIKRREVESKYAEAISELYKTGL